MAIHTLTERIGLSGLKLYPLGGHDAGSASCFLVVQGGIAIMIDCGLDMSRLGRDFASLNDIKDESLEMGNDKFYPNFDILIQLLREGIKLEAVLVTHAHFDHFGGINRLFEILASFGQDLCIAGSAYTLKIVENYMDWVRFIQCKQVKLNTEPIGFGGLTVYPYQTFHSVLGSLGYAIQYNGRNAIVCTGDFKARLNSADDLAETTRQLQAITDHLDIQLVVLDGTNAEKPGWVTTESSVIQTIGAILSQTSERVVLSQFASNINRLELVYNLVQARAGVMATYGSSFTAYLNAAMRADLVYMELDKPAHANVLAVAGCQAEANSALARLSNGEIIKDIRLKPSDTFILSSRPIPGQPILQARIAAMLERIYELCHGQVYIDSSLPEGMPGIRRDNLHVSGHGYSEDIRFALDILRPSVVLPYHCSTSAAAAVTQIAASVGAATI